ncbi:MaoC family dehydratase [Serratia sp. NPDC078593]|uniref:MaoC family dehydratase n=1 Tax=unclassified Serratia (in: enterobacteria) TaxID=2647522 RepID=UPI0037D1BB2C
MLLNYSLQDAERWAAFSGDYNPIHFDLQQARKLGGERLTVHGMRAMLDMKRRLSEILLADLPAADYFSFSARLRQPVQCGVGYQLSVKSEAQRVSGKLFATADGENCFTAKLAAAKPLNLADGVTSQLMSRNVINELMEKFPGSPSDNTQQWSFFDALLFQRIVTAPETLETVRQIVPEIQAKTLIEVFAQIPVVQTHHDVHFSSRLLLDSAWLHNDEPLYYAILPTLTVGNKETGLVVRTELQCWTARQPLIATAVTLKTLPLLSAAVMDNDEKNSDK